MNEILGRLGAGFIFWESSRVEKL